jgi:hypothetical protein
MSTQFHVVEKIGLTTLNALKYSSRKHYITIDPKIVNSYELTSGDILKVQFIEVRKDRERANEEKEKED